MPLTDLLVPTYRQMAGSSDGLLGGALQQRPGAVGSRLAARLAPNMLPLASWIRFAAFRAHAAVFRLTGRALPARRAQAAAEAREARDRPGAVAETRARIAQAPACLDAPGPGALDGGAARAIALDPPDSLAFDLTGEACAQDGALPQFYFNVVTAYAILRNRGIAVGKAGHVPYLFAYRRAGAALG
jgi:uncharacterized protein